MGRELTFADAKIIDLVSGAIEMVRIRLRRRNISMDVHNRHNTAIGKRDMEFAPWLSAENAITMKLLRGLGNLKNAKRASVSSTQEN